jgi:hypothetical protein
VHSTGCVIVTGAWLLTRDGGTPSGNGAGDSSQGHAFDLSCCLLLEDIGLSVLVDDAGTKGTSPGVPFFRATRNAQQPPSRVA